MPVWNFIQFSTVVGCYYLTFGKWTYAYQLGNDGTIVPVSLWSKYNRQMEKIHKYHRANGTAIPEVEPRVKAPTQTPTSGTYQRHGHNASSHANEAVAQAAKLSNNQNSSVPANKTATQKVALPPTAARQSGGPTSKSPNVVVNQSVAE